MNIKKIYLIRHGQTDLNHKGIVQGSGVDSDLNDLGAEQAKAFFETYKTVCFDKIYVSGLKRTHQSVAPFKRLNIPMEVIPELNEISWGVREGVPVDEEGETYYQSMIKSWRRGDTHVSIEGGESPDQVRVRLQEGLARIMSNERENTILICMHGRAMRVLLTIMLNYPLKGMDLFEHHNLCLYKLVHTGGMFHIEKFNDQSHLSN